MNAELPRAEVMIYSPFLSPYRQELLGAVVSIGRASSCSIPIKDRYLSRKHAEIVADGGSWMLKDLGSANGTYLNGERVERDQTLQPGDRIRLGDTEIVFQLPETKTDRFVAVQAPSRATISIPVTEIQESQSDSGRLVTLNMLARELIEDRPMHELFGFIVDGVMKHLRPSRAALGLLSDDRKSFRNVEVRRHDPNDRSDLKISATLLQDIIDQGRALAYIDVNEDQKLSRADSIILQGIHSILCAPLLIGGSVEGVLYVDYLFNQRSISEEDVRLLAQIARFAATKLETTRLREDAIEKRLIDEELRTASAIQRRLLPLAPPEVPGYTLAGSNRPCRTVSGDYFDFIDRPDGKLYFVIGDVSGKGVTAGLMMSGLQVAFRIFAKDDPDPASFISKLNTSLKETLPESRFVTLFLGRLDTSSGIVEYANAGHPPPLWLRKRTVDELSETDVILGVITRPDYTGRSLQLEVGDSLVLFTDGVTEALSPENDDLGSGPLKEALASYHGGTAESIAQKVDELVMQHAGDEAALQDDVTVVVVSRSPDGIAARDDSTMNR